MHARCKCTGVTGGGIAQVARINSGVDLGRSARELDISPGARIEQKDHGERIPRIHWAVTGSAASSTDDAREGEAQSELTERHVWGEQETRCSNEAVVSDAVEALGEHVQQEPSHELEWGEPHRLPTCEPIGAIINQCWPERPRPSKPVHVAECRL